MAQPEQPVLTTRCVRGRDYSGVRVDVKASEVTLGYEVARGGASVVFRGAFGGQQVAVKRPSLSSRAEMDRYHRELQLLRRAAAGRVEAWRVDSMISAHAARCSTARSATRTCAASWLRAPGRRSTTCSSRSWRADLRADCEALQLTALAGPRQPGRPVAHAALAPDLAGATVACMLHACANSALTTCRLSCCTAARSPPACTTSTR